MEQKIQAAGLPWFERDDYESFRPILPDRQWHATFHAWESAALQNFQRLQDQGIRPIKVQVRSADFVAWCRAAGIDVDTQALLRYANEGAYRAIVDMQ